MDSINDKNQRDESSSDLYFKIFRGLGKILNEVGILGFIVLIIGFIIICFPNQSQKQQIVDSWILFKGSNIIPVITVLCLLIALIGQQIHYKRSLALKDERINELANNKNSKYKNKLKSQLSTSNKDIK